jgi:molybdopterin synthase sulfur carrier subunit
MAHVTFTPHLNRFFPTLAPCDIDRPTVRAVVAELERRYPGFASYIVDEAGRLRRHVNIFVGEEPIRDREALGDALKASTPIFIVQALSGG